MIRNIQRAMTALFGLALALTIGLPAMAQEADMMPSGEQSVTADYGKGCCEVCCCSGGFYGDVQYLRLKAHESYDDTFDGVSSNDGIRFALGYEGCDGLGARVRYFHFDGVQDILNGITGLQMSYIDFEVTQSFCLCNLDGMVSAGYRHGRGRRYDDDLSDDFEGDGVTLGLQVKRDITCNLSLYAWAQHSILFGEDAENDVDTSMLDWTEVQLGVQYSTCLAGYNTAITAGVEAQRFGEFYDTDNNAGLVGWFLSAGVTY